MGYGLFVAVALALLSSHAHAGTQFIRDVSDLCHDSDHISLILPVFSDDMTIVYGDFPSYGNPVGDMRRYKCSFSVLPGYTVTVVNVETDLQPHIASDLVRYVERTASCS